MSEPRAKISRRASIDLGTNTCLLLIVDWDYSKNNLSKIIEDHSTVVRLGEGVDQARCLQPGPIVRVLSCLHFYAERVRAQGLDPSVVLSVATSQARDAKNSAEFFSKVKSETGFTFSTLTGEEEARATFLGALLPQMDPSQSVVIDIGGGSTEVTTLDWEKSVDIGSVRLTERYLKSDPVTEAEYQSCQSAIDQGLGDFTPCLTSIKKGSLLVGVAGTVTTLASWKMGLEKFDRQSLDQTLLNQSEILEMIQKLKEMKVSERCAQVGIDSHRADVLLAGAMILSQTMNHLGFEACSVSTRGLRFGVFFKTPGGEGHAAES